MSFFFFFPPLREIILNVTIKDFMTVLLPLQNIFQFG